MRSSALFHHKRHLYCHHHDDILITSALTSGGGSRPWPPWRAARSSARRSTGQASPCLGDDVHDDGLGHVVLMFMMVV